MHINRVGYWAGLAAVGATLAYDVVQVLQVRSEEHTSELQSH